MEEDADVAFALEDAKIAGGLLGGTGLPEDRKR